MKKRFFDAFALAFLVSVTFLSCTSTKKSEEPKKEAPKISDSYKMIEKNEEFDFISSKISFPEFENFLPLNKIIRNSVLNNYSNFKSYAQKSWQEINDLNSKDSSPSFPPFEFVAKSNVFISENLVSVIVSTYVYSGGAHGNTTLQSFNYEKSSGKFLNICEVSNMSYDLIAKKCRAQLIEKLVKKNEYVSTLAEEDEMIKMINEGTFPQAGNFEIFTVSNNEATLYFEPYSVAPYSYGIQKVVIKLP